MNLLALAAFQQIAEHGGIGPASRAAGQPKTTLSRRLRELEEQLGVRLVERGPRVFRLTEEGATLASRTRHLLAELEEAEQAVAGGLATPRGRLRVSVPGLFADVHMGRIAADFVSRYPEIELEVLSDDRLIDPLEEGVDVVVRVNPDPREDLVGHRILDDEMLLVAANSLARPEGGDDAGKAATVPAILLPTTPEAPPWRVEGKRGTDIFTPRPVLRLSSVLMARSAVRCGVGVAVLPRSLVAADLHTGLLACWGVFPDRKAELWVLHTSRRLRSPRVSAFVTFIRAALSDRQDATSG